MIRAIPLDVPVDPDDEEARRLLEEELNRADAPPEEPPSWIEDFLDWLRELLGNNQPAGEPTVGFDAGPTVGIIIAVVGIWFIVRCCLGLYYLIQDEPYPRPMSWLF